jgi:hypothetical protein
MKWTKAIEKISRLFGKTPKPEATFVIKDEPRSYNPDNDLALQACYTQERLEGRG